MILSDTKMKAYSPLLLVRGMASGGFFELHRWLGDVRMTTIELPDLSNLKPGNTFRQQGPFIKARHGSVTKNRTIIRRSSWEAPQGLGILSASLPVITSSKRAGLEVVIKQPGSVVYNNDLKLRIDNSARDLAAKASDGNTSGEAAAAYNSFMTKLNAVHRLATASHGSIELIASLRPRNRFSGGGGAWITASVEVVMIVLPSDDYYEQVLNILKLGLDSGYQGDILAVFKEAMNVFGTGSPDEEDDEDEDEIVELDEDDEEVDDDGDKPA